MAISSENFNRAMEGAMRESVEDFKRNLNWLPPGYEPPTYTRWQRAKIRFRNRATDARRKLAFKIPPELERYYDDY